MEEKREGKWKEMGNVDMRKDPRWGNKREEEEIENNMVYGSGKRKEKQG